MHSFISWSGLATAAIALLAPVRAAFAHGADPQLHVGNEYESCYLDLHPELTQSEFRQFAREAGLAARFQQLAPAPTLGVGRLQISLGFTASVIDDSEGAWNNTFSHPESDHWLGDVQKFPRLILRYGVSDAVDLGAWGTLNPQSNFGFV